MSIKTKPWNASDYLDTPEMIEEYLKASLEAVRETGDVRIFNKALQVVVKTDKMFIIDEKIGSDQESQHRTLTQNSKLLFDTVAKAVSAFGFKLTIEPV